jgi:hypothetical protein
LLKQLPYFGVSNTSFVTLKLVLPPKKLLLVWLMEALFLAQWLYSVERYGMGKLTIEEGRVLSLLGDLLHEADPDAEAQQPMSARLLIVWADQFDGVNVWGSTHPPLILLTVVTPSLAKIFRSAAAMIRAERDSSMVDVRKASNGLLTY